MNLFVATAEGIAGSAKPSKRVLSGLGLPSSAVDQIVNVVSDWSTGCGMHDTRDDDGRLSNSIVIADKSLPPQRIQSCIASGIVFSYGLHIRMNQAFDNPNDYVQFLLLARATSDCERSFGARDETKAMRDAIVECILSKLKVKLSQ